MSRPPRRVVVFEHLTLDGSGELVRTLMRHGLVDEFVLLIHPLVLGSGRRLFTDIDGRTALRLVDAKPSPSGVVIATYRPASASDEGVLQ